MRRLLKYLKPYVLLIVLAIIFLFIQVNADLALPDYLSDIVNVGIQQNGVEDAVPDAIRLDTMDKLRLFMGEEDAQFVLDNYQLLDPGSAEAEDLLKTYSLITEDAVYILGDIDQNQNDQLNSILGKAFVAVAGIQQMVENPDATLPFGEGFDFDTSRIPTGMDIFQALGMMPEDMRIEMAGKMEEAFESLGDSMITQMAVGAVKSEYEALGMDPGKIQRDYILRIGGAMLLVSLAGGAATIAAGYLSAKTAAGAARDIRAAVFKKVESFTSAEFSKFSTASLITRSTNDITQVQTMIFMFMRMMLFAPIMGVGGVIKAIDKSASMWWLIGLAVLVLIGMIVVVFSVAVPKFKLMQDLIDRLNLVTRENLSGMMVIRAFNKEEDELVRFDKANKDLTDTGLFISRVMVMMMPLMMLVMNGLSLAIIWVGAHQIAESALQVGDMMAYMQYAMQIVMSFLMMSMMFIFLPRAAVSGARIADVLDTEVEIQDSENPKSFPVPFRGEIEFKGVSFKYPDAEDEIIQDINFTARPGETTAFIGSTGCGKSTVINLIPRFYDVSEGSVLLDGVDVREVRQSDLRDRIGYVPQQGTLFSGTIESNMLYADKDAATVDIREALDIAQASEFVFDDEEGLDSEISQGGTNVSGGQRQRLAIARALVKKPPIFIFDDSFSALDFKTDSMLRKELKDKTGESTVLIVTQRVATVKNADQIIVLDKGRVVGKGNHQELMKICETYQEIASSQLSEEELA